MPFAQTPEFETLSVLLDIFGKTIERLPDNKLLKDL
jgi:hypothetical protein